MRKLSFSWWVLISLVWIGGVPGFASGTQFPDTPAGRQTAAWLEAFNHGDLDRYRDFLEKNFPSRVGQLDHEMDFRQMTGGFELRKVEASEPTKLVVLVQEQLSDQFGRLTVEVGTADPHLITKMDMQRVRGSTAIWKSVPHRVM